MNELVAAAKALADPSRLRILMAARRQELCVCELCDVLGATQSTLSTHLKVVRDAGLVSATKRGKWMYYAITPRARRLLDPLAREFAASLESDRVLRADARKLSARLKLRDNGSCCVGFDKREGCPEK